MDRSATVRWLRGHPRAADAALAAAVTSLAIAMHLLGSGFAEVLTLREPSWWTVPFVVAASAPIAWRRTHPVGSATFVVAAQIACELLRLEGTGWIGLLVAIYSVGAHAEGRRRTVGTTALLAVIGALLLSGFVSGEIGMATVIGTEAMVVAAYLVGDNVRRRRQHLESLAERAERAEREQELIAQARIRDERGRLARELHDVVAHSVSVMIIQAGAARRSLPHRPDDATAVLREVEVTGRRAMDELRRVLGVLRRDPHEAEGGDAPPLGPQPGLDDLRELVRLDPDLPVHLAVGDSVGDLPHGVAVSVYRLVQEALTNVRRHAGSVGRVDVAVAVDAGVLDVRVDDDGRGAANATATLGRDGRSRRDGFGITGMHERAQALGGSVVAGPRRGGGWRVHGRIPIGAAATSAHSPARAST